MLLKKARLIPFSPDSAYENMAIDEYLTRFYLETGVPVLRLYAWRPDALSVGRFQDKDTLNLEAIKNDKLQLVRRMTGGGAIYHSDEVTYSLCFRDSDFGWKDLTVKDSYKKLNSFIVNAFKKSGLSAAFACDSGAFKEQGRSALCYAGFEMFDITVNGKKLGGNAQARIKDMVFQHGSIPLRAKPEAAKYIKNAPKELNYTCFNDEIKRDTGPAEVYSNLIACFMETTGLDVYEHPLEMDEKKEIVKIMTQKYISPVWNLEGKG